MNIINNELFTIREKYEVEEKFIGERQSKICVVHDIFEYPEDVYKFIKEHPIELNKTYDADFNYAGPSAVHNTPGYVADVRLEVRPLRRFMNWMTSQHFKDPEYYRNINVRINAFTSGLTALKRACYPHTDSYRSSYSATIYLDKKNLGGTSFYRFNNGLEYNINTKLYDERMIEFDKWNNHWSHSTLCEFNTIDNDDNWTMYHLESMEWNKVVVYEAGLFHNAFVKPDMYKNEYRTSINLFALG